MMDFDRQRLVGGLITLATALFLMAVAPRFPYRRAARVAALVIYGAALVGVVVWAVLWLVGAVPGK
jgi:hypothetical protein